MALFQFEQVYLKNIPDDPLNIEALFFGKQEQCILVFYDFNFFYVNKGPSLHINTYGEWDISGQSSIPSFHLLKVTRDYKMDRIYLVLQEGVIKIASAFSTHHGHPSQFMRLALPGDGELFTTWMAEAKGCESFDIIDFRYL